MAKLKKQPIRDWTNYVIGFECKKKQIKIIMCEKSQADNLISKYHYSKKTNKKFIFKYVSLL